MTVIVRPYDAAVDEAWATAFLDQEIGGRWQARRGELHDVLVPGLGFVAERDGERVGLLTYRLEDDPLAVELSSMAALPRQSGAGSALVAALHAEVRRLGRDRIRVVTTNDNVDALRFYQRRGFRLIELRVGAVDASREGLKPAVGRLGEHGIPLRDELELELRV